MKKTFLFLIGLAIIISGCKKTAESEKKAYESNLKSINSLSYEFPSFGNAVREQVALAEPVAKAAEAMADDESKMKKYAEANSFLRPVFVRNLDEIKSTMSAIKTKLTAVRDLKTGSQELDKVKYAARDAEDALNRAERDLRSPVLNRAAADGITGIVLRKLTDSLKPLETLLADATKKIDDKKAAIDKQKASLTKAVEKAKDIKCSYCGTLNIATAKVCKSCGSPLKK
jgi:DNA repair exonuclease SbcCD ATPase subunit